MLEEMVKNEYGKTAWGRAFLEALWRMDHDARLNRGKTYANTGKVKHMVVNDDGTVSAVVQGTEVYRVKVRFDVFSAENKAAILGIIQQNVLILGKILFGELPPELLQLLTEAKIKLFPFSWRDMHASCSCPDHGNPCKHMAAVYFHLTTHIDRDPFTLFRLRGVNLIGHFGISQSDTDPGYPLPKEHLVKSVEVNNDYLAKKVESAKIPDMANFILDCLKPNPPYCLALDFKEVLNEFYVCAEKKTPKLLSSIAVISENHWSSEIDLEDMHRVIAHSLIIFPIDSKFNDHLIWIHNDVFDTSPEDISRVFKSMPHTSSMVRVSQDQGEFIQRWVKIDIMVALQLFLILTNDFGSPSYRWFYYAFRVALGIINARAYIPDVLPLVVNDWDGKISKFKIVWKPLCTSEIVADQFKQLANVFPKEYNVVNLDSNPLDSEGAAMHLLTSIMTKFVLSLDFMHKKQKNNPPKESTAFFVGIPYPVYNVNEENTAKSIAKEFGVFDLMKLEFKIHVFVQPVTYGTPESENADYNMSVKLSDKDEEGEGLTIRRFLTTKPHHRTQVLKLIATLHPYLPLLHQLLECDSLPIIHTQLEQFVMDTANIFTNIGVVVVMPKELRDLLRPEATLLASAVADLEKYPDRYRTFISLADMLQFNWMISLGGEMISVTEFKRLVAGGNKLIKYKDKYIAVSGDEMKKLMTVSSKKPNKMSPYELLKESLSKNTMVRFSGTVDGFMKNLTRVTDHPVPHNLTATLRPYQVVGYQWMMSNLMNGFGSILADDMGLGKTIQTITVILQLKNNGHLKHPVLIVVPASVLSNWEREVKRFAPSLTVSRHYGASRFLGTSLKVPIGPLEVDVKEFASPKLKRPKVAAAKLPSAHHASALGRETKCINTTVELSPKTYLSKAINKSVASTVVKSEDDDILAMENCSLASIIKAKKLRLKAEVKKENSSADCNLPDIEPSSSSAGINLSSDSLPDISSPGRNITSNLNLSQESLPDIKSTDMKATIKKEPCLQDVTNSKACTPLKRKCESPDLNKSVCKKMKNMGCDIILTTYQLMQRDIEILVKNNFGMVVIDEAQKIKNAKTQTAKALKRIKSPMRAALSGTPVENNLNELWSVFDFVLPKYLGSAKDFAHQFAKPIEITRNPEVVETLKKVTAPFMLRRLKTDRNIIKDLPDKIVENQYVTLTTEQAALYESKVKNVEKLLAELEDKRSRNTFIFELMLRLKQICNHPANYHKDKTRDVESSGKMKLLVELMETILSRGEKALIFTQFVEMIKIMSFVLQKHFHVQTLSFHGSLTQQQKDDVIEKFQNQPHYQILIVSTKAGGVGLNLTAANHVFHYDLWYNPAVENQATDRAFRIGQQKNVFVYRFITENTFEEKIDYMIQQKKELSELTISQREEWIGKLSNDQIKDLFGHNQDTQVPKG